MGPPGARWHLLPNALQNRFGGSAAVSTGGRWPSRAQTLGLHGTQRDEGRSCAHLPCPARAWGSPSFGAWTPDLVSGTEEVLRERNPTLPGRGSMGNPGVLPDCRTASVSQIKAVPGQAVGSDGESARFHSFGDLMTLRTGNKLGGNEKRRRRRRNERK